MSFFILIKNSIKQYDFPYLGGEEPNNVDETQVNSQRQKVHRFHKDHQGALVLAKDLMSKNVTYLTVNDSAETASKMMKKLNVHHAPIVEANKIAGIVTSTDIHGVEGDILLEDEKLKHIMSNTVLCVSEDTPLQHILEVFVNEYIHCLPVINESLSMCGIITQTDIFKWVLENRKFKK
jgi:CBS-domain-containing membrane protein